MELTTPKMPTLTHPDLPQSVTHSYPHQLCSFSWPTAAAVIRVMNVPVKVNGYFYPQLILDKMMSLRILLTLLAHRRFITVNLPILG